MDLSHIKDILEIISHIASILGIPAAIFLFINEKNKEREEREYGTYDALNEKYLEFTQLCLSYPNLDIFDQAKSKKRQLSDEEAVQEKQLFKILISIFCRAYLMYKDHRKQMKENQWMGWEEYVLLYIHRESFVAAWKELGHTFDKRFYLYMNELYKKS